MPRKLDAGFDGRYLMSRVLMTSTMKSEPGTPPMRAPAKSFGVPLSAAATCIVGGKAEGGRAAALVDAVVAAGAAGTAPAEPAIVSRPGTVARLRCGRGGSLAMAFVPCYDDARRGLRSHRLNPALGAILSPR